jgi:hypothetical protein
VWNIAQLVCIAIRAFSLLKEYNSKEKNEQCFSEKIAHFFMNIDLVCWNELHYTLVMMMITLVGDDLWHIWCSYTLSYSLLSEKLLKNSFFCIPAHLKRVNFYFSFIYHRWRSIWLNFVHTHTRTHFVHIVSEIW